MDTDGAVSTGGTLGDELDSRETTSEAVIRAVAAAAGVDPVELTPPLYDVVDPEALDALVENGSDSIRISFTYGHHEVSVESGPTVIVRPVSTDD